MDTTAKIIIDAVRAEAEAQLNDAVSSMYDDNSAYSDTARFVSETLSSLADRIERAVQPAPQADSPAFEFSTLPPRVMTVRVTREMVDDISADPDPEPYVGFSGTRYTLAETSRAALNDGPVAFDPRTHAYGPTEDLR